MWLFRWWKVILFFLRYFFICILGSKLIFEPFFNKAECSYKRYQPFPFSTDGSSNCVYQKSACNEDGQYVFHKGISKNDTTCGCNFLKGYTFITKPRHKCYCMPSEEDCSCYKHACNFKGKYQIYPQHANDISVLLNALKKMRTCSSFTMKVHFCNCQNQFVSTDSSFIFLFLL